jgi:hypothetical protein
MFDTRANFQSGGRIAPGMAAPWLPTVNAAGEAVLLNERFIRR